MTDLQTTETPAEPAGPEPLLRGRFSIYEKEGQMAVFYRLDGQEEDTRLDIPAWAIAAGRQAIEGQGQLGMLGMVRAALNGRG